MRFYRYFIYCSILSLLIYFYILIIKIPFGFSAQIHDSYFVLKLNTFPISLFIFCLISAYLWYKIYNQKTIRNTFLKEILFYSSLVFCLLAIIGFPLSLILNGELPPQEIIHLSTLNFLCQLFVMGVSILLFIISSIYHFLKL